MMMQISVKTLESLLLEKHVFDIPENIKSAIEKSVETRDVNTLNQEYSNILNTYRNFRQLMRPIEIDYHGITTIDAYSLFYLPRNIGIPWLAFRDLAVHPAFQSIPDNINVLDFGSGTGAVSLGLLQLYNHIKPFSNGIINIVSIDVCNEALVRQKRLIKESGLKGNHITIQSDLNDIKNSMDKLQKYGKYKFIFIANCFTELNNEIAKKWICNLAGLLDDTGAIIIAEAQRDYIKRTISILAADAINYGLFVYYPCVSLFCGRDNYCWA
jgi:hypothetical protein